MEKDKINQNTAEFSGEKSAEFSDEKSAEISSEEKPKKLFGKAGILSLAGEIALVIPLIVLLIFLSRFFH